MLTKKLFNDNCAFRIGVAEIYTTTYAIYYYAYNLTDHLGNVRAVVSKDGDNLEMVSISDFYPFGMEIPGRLKVPSEGQYRFDYQGQFAERDEETGYNSFEYRSYDNRIGRWLTPDPVKRYNTSVYSGMGNNPVIYNDPDGRDIIILLDIQGAAGIFGHMGMLIGSDAVLNDKGEIVSGGWYYYSKNDAKYDLCGPSIDPNKGNVYKTINDFYLSEYNTEQHDDGYERALRFETTTDQDEVMKQVAKREVTGYYWITADDCRTSCMNTLLSGKAISLGEYSFLQQLIPRIQFMMLKWYTSGYEISTKKEIIEIGPFMRQSEFDKLFKKN